MESRHNDTRPVQCEECGWKGQVMDCYHGYIADDMSKEVEPEDRCPKCDSDQLAIEEDSG